jgi:site-specific DNA recombinase
MARKSRRNITFDTISQSTNSLKYSTALYTRLSSEDKDEDCIETQISTLKNYIADKPEFELFDIYVDNGNTGTNFNRPDFQRMMHDIKNNSINCIIVRDLSRLGREYIQTSELIETVFPFIGVRFISVSDNYDSFDSKCNNIQLLVSAKNILNDNYAKNVSKNVFTAYELLQKEGKFSGQYAAYGYLKSKEDKHKLIIDPETAPTVQNIFKWKLDGMGNLLIARRLNEQSILSPNNYRYSIGIVKHQKYANPLPWKADTVRIILTNPIYVGDMVQHKKQQALFMGQPKTKRLPPDEWVRIKNTHEPIISRDVFDEVQNLLKLQREKRKAKKTTEENIFKGLFICPECGRKLQRHNGLFLCPTYLETKKLSCKREPLKENQLREIVYQLIVKQINQGVNLLEIINEFKNSPLYSQKNNEFQTEISHLNQMLFRINTLKDSLYENYENGILDETEYKYGVQKYNIDEKQIRKQLEEMQMNQTNLNDTVNNNKYLSILNQFKNQKSLTREMLTTIVHHIELYPNNYMYIHWNFRDEYMNLISLLDLSEVCA